MDITFLKDVELVRLRPHAHVRGKSTQYTVIYPDGRDDTLLKDGFRREFHRGLSPETISHTARIHIVNPARS